MILREKLCNRDRVLRGRSRLHLHQSGGVTPMAEVTCVGAEARLLLIVTQDKSVIAGFAVGIDPDTQLMAVASPYDAFALLQSNPRSLVVLDVESMRNASMRLLATICLHRFPCKVIIINSKSNQPSSTDLANTGAQLCGIVAKPVDAALARLEFHQVVKRNAPHFNTIVQISRRTTNALNFISGHYQEKLTIEIVGRAVGISRSCLTRLVREEMNTSVCNLIERVRIAIAAYLLRNGENKLEQVANLTGFCDGSHVSRAFLRCTGRRPRRGSVGCDHGIWDIRTLGSRSPQRCCSSLPRVVVSDQQRQRRTADWTSRS